MRRILPRSVEPWPKIAKYLRTPCFSRPRTSASESVISASLGKPFSSACWTPPALEIARARSRVSSDESDFFGSSIGASVRLCGFGSFFQDWRPARDIRRNCLAQIVRSTLRLRRHRTAKLFKLFGCSWLVQCLVERLRELCDDIVWCPARCIGRAPDIQLIVRGTGFLGARHIRNRCKAFVRRQHDAADLAGLHRSNHADDLFTKIVDMSADEIVHGRPGAAIGDRCRFEVENLVEKQTCHVRGAADATEGLFGVRPFFFRPLDEFFDVLRRD